MAEWKLGGGKSKEHIPYKVNGIDRVWAVGGMMNIDVDYLPSELWPLQKSKHRPFDLNIVDGGRNTDFSSYAFHLAHKGYSVDQIQSVIRGMNGYILEAPLKDSELDEILRNETLQKLKEISEQKDEKNLSHVAVADEIIEQFQLVTVHDTLFTYCEGVYVPFDKGEIDAFMSEQYPIAKINFKREMSDYLKGKTHE